MPVFCSKMAVSPCHWANLNGIENKCMETLLITPDSLLRPSW